VVTREAQVSGGVGEAVREVEHRVRLQQQPVEISDEVRGQEEPERLVGEEAQRGAEAAGGLIDEINGFRHASVGTSSLNTIDSTSRLLVPVIP